MNIKRKRIEALTSAWSIIISKADLKREDVVNILRSVYESMKVEPIRGASAPSDIFDKEVASLYIIGKWGLGIDKDVPEDVFRNVFSLELQFDKMFEVLKRSTTREEFCKELGDLCSRFDDSFIARFLRFVFTLYYFGFASFDDLILTLKKIYAFFEHFQETVRRFTKFVIAYEVGSRIASGKIRNEMELNMEKNLLALSIGIPRAVPSSSYIVEVSKHFFALPQNIVKKLVKESKTNKGEKKDVQDND
ncbi:MAG: DUF2192 domain-containing protein [Ignisphaera sp.]|nr:DUF2192 domain-containing protein [Ignisphaera sp.]